QSGNTAPVLVYVGQQKHIHANAVEGEDSVLIQQPYSGGLHKKTIGSDKDKRVPYCFDQEKEWRFNLHPKGTGLKRGVTKLDFDDSSWKHISVLNWWQCQGFSGYHGAAWYRIKFKKPQVKDNERVRLLIGAIDGNAKIYL